MPLSKSDAEERSFKLGLSFKPTAPISRQDLFAGRKSQVRDIIDVIHQQGQHAVLYGERGVGKTSLSNMIFPNLRSSDALLLIPQINCIAHDTYPAIWKRVFEEILFISSKNEIPLSETATKLLEEFTGTFADSIDPDNVRQLFRMD